MAARSITSCPIDLPDVHSAMGTMEGRDQRSGNPIGADERKGGLYYYRRFPTLCVVTVPGLSQFELWHRRLGHPSNRVLKLVPTIQGSLSRQQLESACTICPQAKQCRESFPLSDNRTSHVFELLHCDLWGANKIPSSNGEFYFLTIVDYPRAYGFIYYILNPMCSNRFACFLLWLHVNFRLARALIFQSDLPVRFWGECVLGAVHLINRTSCGLLENNSPIEVLTAPTSLGGADVEPGGGVVHDMDEAWQVVPVHSPAEPVAASIALSAAMDEPLEGVSLSDSVATLPPDVVVGADPSGSSPVLGWGVEPHIFKEALSDPGWYEAMAKEVAALEANGTWVMASLPTDNKALG
ncbi:hypothetical protein LIER_22050 [Lithospermum erythrorhizon]|uniref:GAG-pre-integrase domain-containing protein n=1 Tax=Lithospermum erythrorhizon TaxID=34254 RepID=A0AAV3QSL5_LITER